MGIVADFVAQFHESFIRQGIEGGKKAAYTLRNVILEHVKDNPGDYEVVARVICNMTGLAKALKRDGCIENESDFKDFTLGFTQGKATFDFIDVGYGKERADSKIRGMLLSVGYPGSDFKLTSYAPESTKWNLRNLNCIQILLGISHDAGYAPFLDEILQDDQTRRKITVIEGFPAVKELVTTGVNVLRLSPSLFRTEKLLDRVPSFPQGAPTAPAAQAKPSAPTPPPGIPAPTPPANSVSYANAIQKASPPPQITLPLQIKPATAPARPKPAPWNPGPRGLDKPIVVNQAVLEAVKKRKDNQKLCNNHYLRGPCAKGDSCCFEHNYKPNQEELNAIAYLARQNPCTNGQDCVLEGCIYGHHCPNVVNGTCMHPYCKFRVDEHPPGTKFRNPKTADH